jgi:carboxyl-terminal processing protease
MAEPTAQRLGVSKSFFFCIIALVAMVGYVAGTRNQEIMATVGPLLGFKVASGSLDLTTVQDTYRQLKANYDGTLDEQKLIDGANRGLVAAAGDQYTVFMDAKEAEEFNSDLSGDIGGGIGAEIGIRDNEPTIVRVLDGNAAKKAGVLAGDVIVAVNDQSARGWTSDKAATAIRGEVGTTVKLAVMRGTEEKVFTLTRANVINPSVTSTVANGIGTMTITRFDSETGTLTRQVAQDFKRQNVRAVILDLRSNGGGYLSAAQDVAGLWLDKKTVVTERAFGKVVDTISSGSNPLLAGLPTVVLVNAGTASASEIVAGALQDYKAATLIGEKTYGKGSVQKVIDLQGGSLLKVTVARWYTPNGKNITSEGIAPDTVVELTADDANKGNDPQRAAAEAKLTQ